MKKNIAIIHNLPEGGGLRMLNQIVRRYKSNCKIDLYSISKTPQRNINGVKNIWIKVTPWKGFILYNFWLIFILPVIHKSISKKYGWSKYDLIFASHDYFTKSPYLIRYINNRIIYLCQEPQREYYESWNIHAPFLKDKIANILRYPIKLIDEANVRKVSAIICNSKYSKKIIENIYKKKCEVVYPGVDIEQFFPTTYKKENIILCIGRISRVKGQDFLTKSLKPILNIYKLVLIGDGRKEDIGYLNKIINNSNIKIEIIKKQVTDSELIQYYRKAKVTCIASYNEPFGLSSIESQACGTPVVSVNEGGPKESLLNGVTGYIPKRNEEDFLKKTICTINNVNKMKKNTRKYIVENWTWEITLKPLDKYFLDN